MTLQLLSPMGQSVLCLPMTPSDPSGIKRGARALKLWLPPNRGGSLSPLRVVPLSGTAEANQKGNTLPRTRDATELDPYRAIAESHIRNRTYLARDEEIPLSDFWTFIPLRCHWCKREISPGNAVLQMSLDVRCTNKSACDIAYQRSMHELYPKGKKAKLDADDLTTVVEAVAEVSKNLHGKGKKAKVKPRPVVVSDDNFFELDEDD